MDNLTVYSLFLSHKILSIYHPFGFKVAFCNHLQSLNFAHIDFYASLTEIFENIIITLQGRSSLPQLSQNSERLPVTRLWPSPCYHFTLPTAAQSEYMDITVSRVLFPARSCLPNSGGIVSCLFHSDQVRSLETASKNLSSGEKAICVTVKL